MYVNRNCLVGIKHIIAIVKVIATTYQIKRHANPTMFDKPSDEYAPLA